MRPSSSRVRSVSAGCLPEGWSCAGGRTSTLSPAATSPSMTLSVDILSPTAVRRTLPTGLPSRVAALEPGPASLVDAVPDLSRRRVALDLGDADARGRRSILGGLLLLRDARDRPRERAEERERPRDAEDPIRLHRKLPLPPPRW